MHFFNLQRIEPGMSPVMEQESACCDSASGGIVCAYEGYFSSAIISAMAEVVKTHLNERELEGATRRRLFSSFIEMAQNIAHYSAAGNGCEADHPAMSRRYGAICLSWSSVSYRLCGANPVRADAVDRLRSKLERLRGLTMDDIKREYKAMLRSDPPPDSKGAGLGLLTVARDASAPLEYRFAPTPDSDKVLFHLQTTI